LIIAAIVVLPLLAWLAAGTYLDPRVASWLALPSPLVIGLNLLPDGSLEIARLWQAHLLFIGGLSLLMLLLARMRLAVLLKRG
jgi:hypothetical protein